MGIIDAKFDFYSFDFIWWFVFYTPYFIAGYLIRQDESYPPSWILWVVFISAIVFTSLGEGFLPGARWYSYLSVTVIPMSISLIYLLKRWNKPIYHEIFTRKLALLSFGIYLIHPVVLEIINYQGHEKIQFHPLLAIPVLVTVTFVTSWAGAAIVHRIPYLRRII